MTGYPIELDVSGRRVVVVGAGPVALRRVRGLVESGAQVTVIAPQVADGFAELPVTVLRRRYRDGDVDGAWLVHAATDDHGVNARVVAAADLARIWCVRADDANASTAWTPAVTRHGNVTVAVTAGGDPRRSQRLRAAIAQALADGSLPIRPHRHRSAGAVPVPVASVPVASIPVAPGPVGPAPGPVGPAVGPAPVATVPLGLAPVAPVTVTAASIGVVPAGAGRVGSERRGQRTSGSVALVGGGPGDPELITVRGRRLLAEADVVIADRLGPRGLLAELDPDVEIVEAGKSPGAHSLTQDQINSLIVDRALAGSRVVRLKGGDPFVFGRGGEEALACVRACVPFEVVPGVTSAIAVPASAGIPVTHRGITQDFSVISAHLDPSQPGATVDWEAMAGGLGTLVLLMAVTHLDTIAAELIKRGRDATTPVAVIRDGTLPSQDVLVSTLGRVADDAARRGIRPPAVVVIGEVVGLRAELTKQSCSATDRSVAAGTAEQRGAA